MIKNKSLCVKIVLIILIFLIILLLIYFYKTRLQEKEHFQAQTVMNLNKKINKYLDKNRKKKNKIIKNNKEYEDPAKKFLYNNKIVITGATGGLGYFVAKMLNFHKPTLVICGKKKNKVNKIVEEFKKFNPNVYGIAVDLSKKKGPAELYNKIFKKIHSVDILINNAIITKGSQFLMSKKYDDWMEELSVNVNSNVLLSQKIAYKMKNRDIKGRIINISSDIVKSNNTKLKSGSDIITKNIIEKYSKLLSEELYKYKISVITIRIDEPINTNNKKYFNIDLNKTVYNKYFKGLVGETPDKIMPVFMYVIKAPFHEITGKIITTSNYKNIETNTLPKIIPPHQLKMNKIYKSYNFTKNIKKNENKTYLVKQSPYPMSPNIKKIITKNRMGTINDISKYVPVIDTIIAKNLGLKKENIVLFKTEYDCIKKIIDIFVPKYHTIICTNPSWNYIDLVCVENKITIKYSILISEDKSLYPNFNGILKKITPQTKMIYCSSPNITSGQSIYNNDNEFKDFLDNIPDNILLVIDQRFLEFSLKTPKHDKIIDPLNYIEKYKNIIVIRTFNNIYSIENLELTYILTNKDFATLIKDSQIINPLDRYTEELALNVYQDNYYKKIKHKINVEKNRFIKVLKENKIPYYTSETNFILIDTKSPKDELKTKLEEKNIILYESNDSYNNYWTLPLSTPDINDKIIETLLYSEL